MNFFGNDYGEALFATGVAVEGQRNFGLTNGRAVFISVADAAARMKSVFFCKHDLYYLSTKVWGGGYLARQRTDMAMA